MPEDRLVKRVLCWDREICHNNWCADVKKFEEPEFEYCFNEMCPVDINMFRNLMILRSEKTWRDTIGFKPKLRTYCTFKTEFVLENYLQGYMPRHERSLLVQFRSGTMPLRIETGRWQGKPLQERLCLVCNTGIVEDEFHFSVNVKATVQCVRIYLSQLMNFARILKIWNLDKSLSIY